MTSTKPKKTLVLAAAAMAALLLNGCAQTRAAKKINPPVDWNQKDTASPAQFEFERDKVEVVEGKTHAHYRAKARGFPAGQSYALWVRRLEHAPTLLGEFHVDHAGELVSKDGWHLNRARFSFEDIEPGEPVDYALHSADHGVEAFAHVVPLPLAAKGNGPCHLDLELTSTKEHILLATGRGFEPREQVKTETAFRDGERYQNTVTASAEGTFTEHISPMGLSNVPRPFVFTASSRGCTVSIER
jgi:hypothetical protein